MPAGRPLELAFLGGPPELLFPPVSPVDADIASFEVDGGDIVVLETAIDCHWMPFLRDLHDNLAVIETLAAISSRWMRLVPSFCTVDSCRA